MFRGLPGHKEERPEGVQAGAPAPSRRDDAEARSTSPSVDGPKPYESPQHAAAPTLPIDSLLHFLRRRTPLLLGMPPRLVLTRRVFTRGAFSINEAPEQNLHRSYWPTYWAPATAWKRPWRLWPTAGGGRQPSAARRRYAAASAWRAPI